MILSAMSIAPSLIVREATANDAAALAELVRTTFNERLGQHLSRAELGTFLADCLNGSQHGRCFVACIDGALVGYAVASARKTRGSIVDRLYVQKGGDSRAIAMALLLAVQDSGEQQKAAADPLEIYDRWGFVDLPAVRSCLASPWGLGTVPIPDSAAAL